MLSTALTTCCHGYELLCPTCPHNHCVHNLLQYGDGNIHDHAMSVSFDCCSIIAHTMTGHKYLTSIQTQAFVRRQIFIKVSHNNTLHIRNDVTFFEYLSEMYKATS